MPKTKPIIDDEEDKSLGQNDEPVNNLVKIVKQDGKFYTKPQLEPLTASELIISQDMTQEAAEDWIHRNSVRR